MGLKHNMTWNNTITQGNIMTRGNTIAGGNIMARVNTITFVFGHGVAEGGIPLWRI